jgi:putative nucleotidyltransferase with HDIG domain
MAELPIDDHIEAFPSMPGAAAHLLALLNDDDHDISQVEKALRMDPGLTANILKLTNSAFFGFPNQIGSVRQATVMLGTRRLVQLVVTSCVNALMDDFVPGYELPAGELWRHSLAVSVTAEDLVRNLNLANADLVFTAALLHDIGKLILGDFIKKDIHRIEAQTSGEVPFEKAVREVLGTDHAEVGALVLEKWSLPTEIIHAVRWHHDPEASEQKNNITDVVHIANMLCVMIGIGVGRDGLQHFPSEGATQRLGVNASLLETVASRTMQWVEELNEITTAK